MVPPVRLRLFGAFEGEVNGQPLGPLRSRKERLLLALLVLANGRQLPRAVLARDLWPAPDHEPGHARRNLRRSVMEVRRALGLEAHRLQAPQTDTLRLELSGAWVDVYQFDQAARSGETEALELALSLYRAPLLSGFPDDHCLLEEREARRSTYQKILDTLSARSMAIGDYERATHWLRRALALPLGAGADAGPWDDTLPERVYRDLMTALFRGGERRAALDVYQELCARLYRERHASPEPETTILYRRLRDQVGRAGGAAVFPVRPTVGKNDEVPGSGDWVEQQPGDPVPFRPRRYTVPEPVADLVGREEAVHEVASCLEGIRLMTLTGVGGIGKTRLAQEVARNTQDEYLDGACFVELAVVTDPERAAEAIAGTLGILRGVPGRTTAETLADFLSARALLLVLDNCEHLISVCAQLATSLLAAAPRLKILATSREPLHVNGEHVWRVPPLPVPEAEEDLRAGVSALARFPSVRLFASRASAADGHFRLADEDAAAVARLSKQLDGIPLAIELAAARVGLLTPVEIADRLEDRFSFLTGGALSSFPRHRTLRAAVDWSYALLTPEEQALLCRLAVFAGGWTLEAAQIVCAGDGIPENAVLDHLNALVNKSLVVAERRTGAQAMRYRFLETLREYAVEALRERGKADTYRRRHADYYASVAYSAEPHLKGADQYLWWRRLDEDTANLNRAMETLLQEDLESALRVGVAVWRFWAQAGRLGEGRSWLERVLERVATSDAAGLPALLHGRVLAASAGLAWLQYDGVAASTLCREALPLVQAAGDDEYVAFSLLIQALSAHFILGQAEMAHAHFREALAVSRSAGDDYHAAMILDCMGLQALSEGKLAVAGDLFDEAVAVARPLQNPWLTALTLLDQGLQRLACGETALARTQITESLRLRLTCADLWGIALSLAGLADVACTGQDAERAARLYGATEELRESIHMFVSPISAPRYQANVATVRAALGEAAFAAAWCAGRALSLPAAVSYAVDA